MGRPLPKRFFGNMNTDDTGFTRDTYQRNAGGGIGGGGVTSINWSNTGSWLSTAGGASAPLAGLALPAPTLPGGVQATWTNYFGAASVTTGAGSVGLVVGDTYTIASIPGLVVTVATSTNNGTNATFTVTTAGSTTTLITDLQGVNITKVTGSGASTFLVDIYLKVVNTVITDPGSGYVGTETFTVTKVNGALGTAPAGTLVLSVASGTAYTSDAFPAIIAYGQTTTGGSNLVGDIVRQRGSKRFYFTTADGSAVCSLVAATPSSAGQMTINATDDSGGTYYITKLSRHKAVVTRNTGTTFATGDIVHWVFSKSDSDWDAATSVVIDNA